MKCVKTSAGKIQRLTDRVAHNLVRAGEARYILKSEWRKSDPGWKDRSAAMRAKEPKKLNK